jgi:hypothetical protein
MQYNTSRILKNFHYKYLLYSLYSSTKARHLFRSADVYSVIQLQVLFRVGHVMGISRRGEDKKERWEELGNTRDICLNIQ